MKATVKRGQEIIATIEDRQVETDFSFEGQLVASLVHMGIPIPNELREGRWRIQVEDPDFKEALRDHLSQYGFDVI